MSDLWLVKNYKNEISGPFSKDNIISMINDKKLTERDAICMSNSDWLNLSDFEMVGKALSIKFPSSLTKDSSLEKTSIIETGELTQEIVVNNKSNIFYKTFKKLKVKLEKMDNSNIITFIIIIVIIFMVVKTLKIFIYS